MVLDEQPAAFEPEGRMLCFKADLQPGEHSVTRS
jgi:hypothetical protein